MRFAWSSVFCALSREDSVQVTRFLRKEVKVNSWILIYRLPWAPKGTVRRLRRLCATRAALQWDFRCCFFYLCLLPSTWMWTTQRCTKDPAAVISATRWTFTCSGRGKFAVLRTYCTNERRLERIERKVRLRDLLTTLTDYSSTWICYIKSLLLW